MSARKWLVRTSLSLSVIGVIALVLSSSAIAASAPIVESESVVGINASEAVLQAKINPQESATTYRFEYGPTAAYGSSLPVPDGSIGSGTESVAVSQLLTGLKGTYHYRAVAVNAEGTSDGEDHILKTYVAEAAGVDSCPNTEIRGLQSSSYLPDCRAYEMVSPVDKGDANIAAAPLGMTESSVSGEAIKYTSEAAFGDAVGIGLRGAEYIGRRGPDGWVDHSINPEQGSVPGDRVFDAPTQYEDFNADLSEGIYRGKTPVLAGHANVRETANLYLRTDVFSTPPGDYQLLTDSATPLSSPPNHAVGVAFAGASTDLSHVIFETYNNLTPETNGLDPTLPKLYESVNGTVRLAGILPDGTPAAASIAGKGVGGGGATAATEYLRQENWAVNAISSDGSRVIFEATPLVGHSLGNGAVDVGGNLYMRIDGTHTIQLNVSERTLPTPNKPQSATPEAIFEGATPDGSKVFFTSTGLMTDDAGGESVDSEENAKNLYMYDLNAPAGKHLTLISVDHEPSDNFENSCGCGGDRAGTRSTTALFPGSISEDGSYVYFMGGSELVAGQVQDPQTSELYVWHDGDIRAIAEHNSGGSELTWGEGGVQDLHEFRSTPDGKRIIFVDGIPATAERAGGVSVTPGKFFKQDGQRCRSFENQEVCQQVFLYDYDSDRLTCVSCNPSGEGPNGLAQFEDAQDTFGIGQGHTQYSTRAMTPDGRYVFFDSPDPLVPQDTNGARDVYEYDTHIGRVGLISGGTSGFNSAFVDASADGSNVFFTTRQQLVRADNDGSADLYDARAQGGFLSQNVAPPAQCEGDDCQGPAKAAAGLSLPASLTFAGVGNTQSSESKLAVKTRGKPVTRAQKLARALKACRAKPRKKRAVCERQARSRYRVKRTVKHASRRVGR